MELLQLNQRLELLEGRLAFQDIIIEELNQIIIAHQRDIGRLQERLRLLADKLYTQNMFIALPIEETIPPHY